MLEEEICPQHSESKKKKIRNELYKWIISSSLLNNYGNVTWVTLKKPKGVPVIWIVSDSLTIAMGKQSLNVAKKPS